MQKCKKKFAGCAVCNRKILFLQSQNDNDMGGTREGVVNRGMFIERMEGCSKYSRRGI